MFISVQSTNWHDDAMKAEGYFFLLCAWMCVETIPPINVTFIIPDWVKISLYNHIRDFIDNCEHYFSEKTQMSYPKYGFAAKYNISKP